MQRRLLVIIGGAVAAAHFMQLRDRFSPRGDVADNCRRPRADNGVRVLERFCIKVEDRASLHG